LKFAAYDQMLTFSLMSRPSVCLAFVLFPLLLAACRDAKVAYYRVPKEKDAVLAPMAPVAGDGAAPMTAPFVGGAAMAATAVPTADGPGLTWTAPTNWKAKPASAMRKATYSVPGEGGAEGDLSITAFPTDVGGELANVNRWRGQVDLPPLAAADLAGVVTRLESNGLHIAFVDLGGASQRLLGAIVPFGGGTWFFKLGPGPDALIASGKPSFEEFLRTLKPAAQP
jgi:hypothetical protein